ncbi:MAG: lipid-A-disaccharide synthase-related protein [cyanobacterium endosymbiont of Rhopalodia musculus]|uniref:lipid-A-disaccharide synthase-related protein n=1 Tax=cyanobacterium endosymbiont of Epithemia clementina EcSB TaxID=3034674 RepID=UPI00247FB479|nr:lipid-A-disaccharide synthase-related protein [cyanobacterium endosymbiont of Epithemia clementina EcSB]WGT67402.1 lipid-A-disaccharide synthase-related protein [cyanobacterium endosymbiont of Epithemia clementina EcSB]
MAILMVSNGHGEDVIAACIAEQLRELSNAPQIAAFPLVGEGSAYKDYNIPIIGNVKKMPSGGFNKNPKHLLRDVAGGLIELTFYQYKNIHKWGDNGGKILAVGDIVPLLFAWLSGADYGFVGTAKSEYYLRDEKDWLPQTSWLARWFGSMYFPWECWLMSHSRCRGVFPRDRLTSQILEQWPIRVFDLGNPMMDGFESNPTVNLNLKYDSLTIVLLPGSRSPEAQQNWKIILEAIQEIIKEKHKNTFTFLGAISPALNLESFIQFLISKGWICQPIITSKLSLNDPHRLVFNQRQTTLILTQHSYKDCLQMADLAIAMAGTATEQFVGLGKPAITIPGNGPQFTLNFAKKQTYLLGESVILVDHPQQVPTVINSLLKNPQKLQRIADNGRKRLGTSGAAKRIAQCLKDCF